MSAPVYVAICACGTEHRAPTPRLPDGWIRADGPDDAVRCPDCALLGCARHPDPMQRLDAATLAERIAWLHQREDWLVAQLARVTGDRDRHHREWLRRHGYLTRLDAVRARALIDAAPAPPPEAGARADRPRFAPRRIGDLHRPHLPRVPATSAPRVTVSGGARP